VRRAHARRRRERVDAFVPTRRNRIFSSDDVAHRRERRRGGGKRSGAAFVARAALRARDVRFARARGRVSKRAR
jgi:hypothetical protein